MALISVTYTFQNGTVADAPQVNQNFSDIINGLTDGSRSLNVDDITVQGDLTVEGTLSYTTIGGTQYVVAGSQSTQIWDADYAAVQIGGNAYIGADDSTQANNQMHIVHNAYYSNVGQEWTFISSDGASMITFENGVTRFYNTAPGAAGTAVTWVNTMNIGATGIHGLVPSTFDGIAGVTGPQGFTGAAGAAGATGAGGSIAGTTGAWILFGDGTGSYDQSEQLSWDDTGKSLTVGYDSSTESTIKTDSNGLARITPATVGRVAFGETGVFPTTAFANPGIEIGCVNSNNNVVVYAYSSVNPAIYSIGLVDSAPSAGGGTLLQGLYYYGAGYTNATNSARITWDLTGTDTSLSTTVYNSGTQYVNKWDSNLTLNSAWLDSNPTSPKNAVAGKGSLIIDQRNAVQDENAIELMDTFNVDHGYTGVCGVSTWASIRKGSFDTGGVLINGFTEGNQAMGVYGYRKGTAANTSNISYRALYIDPAGGVTGMSSGISVFDVVNSSSTIFSLRGGGSVELGGSDANGNAWDSASAGQYRILYVNSDGKICIGAGDTANT